MPALFVGHGSPMLALAHDDITRSLSALGQEIRSEYGTPRAILMLSAHWYAPATLVQTTTQPRQIYDMYGFPEPLYNVRYAPKGYLPLSQAILSIPELRATPDNTHGIDHGAWTPLVHLFPEADVPVVQLSINAHASAQECLRLGGLLAPLREQGYLIMGSGNIVHNLRLVEWQNSGGTAQTREFDRFVVSAVEQKQYDLLCRYPEHPLASYAVPTPDHFLPLMYVLGAAHEQDTVTVFNQVYNLGSMSMTSFLLSH